MAGGMLPTKADLRAADDGLKGLVVDTPLVFAPALAEMTGAASVHVKLESFQHTGSFKFRGALWRCRQLSPAEREAGVVAYSSGNFAQGLAAAAQSLAIPCTIVMPIDAPERKRHGTEQYGARIVLTEHGDQPREKVASAKASAIARDEGLTLLHPFDDPMVVAGHASIAYEVARHLADRSQPPPTDILCCVGGGGLIAGLALGFQDVYGGIRVHPVEPLGFDGMGRSLRAGERVVVEDKASTICDALQATAPGAVPFAAMQSINASGGSSVTDDDVRSAMKVAADTLRIILEPSGAVPLAAMLRRPKGLQGQDVLLMASGGNIASEKFAEYLGAAA